jgi:cytochrome c oxidase cbb3-type subunit III
MRIVLLVALTLIGACYRDTGEVERGARPIVDIPVGPPPGPDDVGKDVERMENPLKDDPNVLRDGHKLFLSYNCAGCHGDHAGGGMGPSLRDDIWLYGSAPAQIFDSITEGRAHGMPSWGTKIPEEHAWKITAYIKSLRTKAEPQPPSAVPPPPMP